MRMLLLIAIVIVATYGIVNFTPADMKAKIGSTLGIGTFMQSTGDYLRSKLSMPGDPVAKRKTQLDQLSNSIKEVRAALADTTAVSKNSTIAPQSAVEEMRASLQDAEEALAQSDNIIGDLKTGVGDKGAVSSATVRLVNFLIPPSPSSTTPACVPPVK